jgi:hypothetical protein
MRVAMEAASRPSPEPLPDLPVEEPLDAAAATKGPPPGRSAAAPAPEPAAMDGNRSEQTGLNFVDPELFLAADQKPSAVPVSASAPANVSDRQGELQLEDPVVDELLSAPMPPAATVAAPAAPAKAPIHLTPAAASKPAAPATDPAQRAATRVPIARTASLSAAAAKVAAASAASQQRSGVRAAAGAKSVTAAAPTVRPSPANPSAAMPKPPATKAAAPTADKTAAKTEPQPAAKAMAPSLASWANARAAAAPRVSASPTVATVPPAPAAVSRTAATPPPASAPAAPAPAAATAAAPTPAAAVPAAPPMDRDFIARNQVVERYLSGRLPLKGATDFERFCHAHPELLDEIGLPERVNAGLRLLEASGKPEPWQEPPTPAWQKPQVLLALAAMAGILAVALAVVGGSSVTKSHRIAELQQQATERALDPATSRREIRLLPSRTGASNSPAITIGGSPAGAQLVDFKIDESRSAYHTFRVTIDRIDQGRVGIINNLAKDSNGHLRIALNSSALGPGNYQLTLEGLDWRGEPQPDSWVTIGIQR